MYVIIDALGWSSILQKKRIGQETKRKEDKLRKGK